MANRHNNNTTTTRFNESSSSEEQKDAPPVVAVDEEFAPDSIFEIFDDWEREERRRARAAAPPRLPARLTSWRDRALDFCKCFFCYIVGTCVIALCIYIMYKIFSTIKWSSLT
jgi:hypothetical protein